MNSKTDHAISFAIDTHWQDLPQKVQHQTKRCLLDSLGALLAGAKTPVGRMMANVAAKQFSGSEATILIDCRKASAAGAALANGFACNALDIDDGYRMIKGHPGACALPPMLAAAEITSSCNGEQFLTGLLVAYELGIRAGLIRHAIYEIYHSSGSWGAIAGAAAVGRMIGLTPEKLFHAMGCAEYHAPIAPMMKGIDTPSMGKDSIGWGCMVGVMSAIMARDGFTGITPLFDDTPDPDWVENLGHSWEILNLYFKPYAACRWGQPAVAGALSIIRKNRIDPDRIKDIRLRTFAAAARLPNDHPKNTEEAQYNLAYPVAAAILDGEVGPVQVLPPRLHDRRLLQLLDRVTTEVAPEYEAAFPRKTIAEVSITTTDDISYNSGPVEAIWEPPDSLPGDEALEKKFLWLAGPAVGKDNAEALARLIWEFEKCQSIAPLMARCAGSP
ncbi:MAG: MmgE/PrpD family protein [Desulfobacterales bacterium]|jgi:2-methylcitrate dehydratase PrpD